MPHKKYLVTRLPLPPEPGRPGRFDFEYVRHGTANPVHDLRAAAGLAGGAGDRAADGQGLRRGGALAGRGVAPRRREGGAGDRRP